MRKLKQLLKLDDEVYGGEYATELIHGTRVLALDDNGELWHGTLETTEDERRVIDWTPVNTPKDGAAYSEPQLDFFDRWEREANARIQADIDSSGEAVSLETEEQTDSGPISKEIRYSPDDGVEDGEGSDPGE